MTKNAWLVGLLAVALAACGDDSGGGTDSGVPDSGGAEDAGGGDDAGGGEDGGPADAGGGGDDGGTADAGGGDDGGGGVPDDIAPCGPTDWVTGTTTITSTGGFQYSPRCVQVTAGTSVTISAATIHPLAPSTRGTTPSPITVSTTDETVVFSAPGVYPFYCSIHGSNAGTGMAGAVRVVP